MKKRRVMGVVTLVMAFVLSIVATTVAFASFSSDISISGSATAKGAHWSVIFDNLKPAVTGNDNGLTSTAKEVTAPSISGQTAIETYKVELLTPGDYVSYNFRIKNAGDFAAKIDESFAMPTPTCTKGTAGGENDATNVCNNLQYTLKYVTDSSDVKAGDTFNAGEAKEVQLKIYYNKAFSTDDLPTDDVAIENLDILIPFVQS